MPGGKLKRLHVAARVGGHYRLEHHHAGPNLDDRKRVRVSMRVDANHVVQLICEHRNDLRPSWGTRSGAGLGRGTARGRTVTGHTPTGWTGF